MLKYFIPSWINFDRITDQDIRKFFNWSDRGIKHGSNLLIPPWDGFKALYYAKQYRDLHVQSYLKDWGNTMNAWSFTDMPRYVREDIAKRMNKPAILECS